MFGNHIAANITGSMMALAILAATSTALAHHGWSWTTGESIELTGTIVDARLGNPHGTLTMDIDGEQWSVEVGQPWRNERAGVGDHNLVPGARIQVSGQPSSDPDEKRLKAISVSIDGTLHELYPAR